MAAIRTDTAVVGVHDAGAPAGSHGLGPCDDAEALDGLEPASVRLMDHAELEVLSARIRAFLVGAISATGGHLGSNLGVVELTLALHRAFDSPRDQLVWDTGHQAYVHKLLTGRMAAFGGLRQAGGLSGYPNRGESPHDLVENSHASTALSYAFGLARANALRNERRRVVAIVGDGALTGGLAYEALNNIGMARSDVLVVLNDNGRSYAPTVSRLTTAGSCTATAESVTRAFFEALGIRYTGPIDGHDFAELEAGIEAATQVDGPVVLHVHTVKGRGYPPAENDPEKCLHDVAPFDPATGSPRARPTLSYTRAFGTAIVEEAAKRPEVVAVTAAMPGPTGLLSFADRFPERYLDVGIAEQHAVTAAAGMAMGGLRPVVAIYSTFLNRAWDQLYYDVGLHRLPVVFCIDRAGITGDDGASHHGLLDLALLTKVPGMTVLVPSCIEEVATMLRQALDITDGPVAIRWPKTPARTAAPGSGLTAKLLRGGMPARGGLGRSDLAKRSDLANGSLGADPEVCFLGLGKLVEACEEAASLLEADGIGATVWDVRVAKPLDPAMLADAAAHRLVLTAEDGIVDGGVGSMIAAALGGVGAHPTVIPCGVPVDYLPHGKAADLLAGIGLDGFSLYRRALRTLRA